MKELIYYPGFEVQSSEWLKFALLYIERLNPIIPSSGRPYLSEYFNYIMEETDLIQVHNPDPIEGSMATLDAIDSVEKILRFPCSYSPYLGNNIISRWKNNTRQDFVIFNEKYTHDWLYFCIENNLGIETNQGIAVNRQLGYLYMTLLAHIIGDLKGISPITDNHRLNNIQLALRRSESKSETKKVELAQALIKLQLPADLSNLDITEIIKLRNKPQFKQNLNAFHQELDIFLNEVEMKKRPEEFTNTLGSAWNDFREQIATISADMFPYTIGLWFLTQLPVADVERITINSAVGLSLLIKSSMSIGKTWKHTSNKRQARKYLASIKHINYSNIKRVI